MAEKSDYHRRHGRRSESAASKAKRVDPSLDITVFEKSGYISYGACGLPYFVGDMIKEPNDLVSLSVDQMTHKRGVPTFIHHEVTRIDRGADRHRPQSGQRRGLRAP